MQPTSPTLFGLFATPVEYLIPIFQRRYVWTRQRQWDKLWKNVKKTTETALADSNSTREHFMGAMIVRTEPAAEEGRARWSVIDGQQRLITFQLLLDAAEQVLKGLPGKAKVAAAQLETMVENGVAFRDPNDPTTVLKIRPGGTDFKKFLNAMQREEQPEQITNGDLIGAAHYFFHSKISDWVTEDKDLVEERATELANTLQRRLRFVRIEVDSNDHPNLIFETLNARGTPLQAWDLVKNFLLYEERERGGNDITLYTQHLMPVEQDGWWNSRGSDASHDIDLFLFYWLVMRKREKVRADDVYPALLEFAEGKRPADVAEDIQNSASTYRAMMTNGFGTAVDERLRRWRALDIGVSTPLVLWLLQNTSGDQLELSLAAIESFFVRRMVCGIGVAGLNNWFPRVIGELDKVDPADAGKRLVKFVL